MRGDHTTLALQFFVILTMGASATGGMDLGQLHAPEAGSGLLGPRAARAHQRAYFFARRSGLTLLFGGSSS
jgi:hypothetical protein